MSTIILSDPTMSLAMNTRCFTLRSNGKQVGKIPCPQLTRLIVHKGVSISQKALEYLTMCGTPVFFLDSEANITARLSSRSNRDPRMVLHLARAYDDESLRFQLAYKWVEAKIKNSRATLDAYRSNYKNDILNIASKKLSKIIKHLPEVKSIEQLRGHEGMAAKCYYAAFPVLLRPDWITFPGRNRRPPRDPLNATLSYIYAILTRELEMLIEVIGIDSSIGFLHTPEKHRPSLALDMIEPFRAPLADRLTLKLFNLKVLRQEHFQNPHPGSGAININKEGKKIIFESIERWFRSITDDNEELGIHSPVGVLQMEVDQFHKHLKKGSLEDFQPFLTHP